MELKSGLLSETINTPNKSFFSILALRVHHTISMVALRVNRTIPPRITLSKIAVTPTFNWVKRQHFCQTKGQNLIDTHKDPIIIETSSSFARKYPFNKK